MHTQGRAFLVISIVGSMALLSGCIAPLTCPEGERATPEGCVSEDASVPLDVAADAGVDAEQPDAPVCGDTCVGATPFCVGGACVACRDSADCGSLTPMCDAGGCVSCEGRSDCTPAQVADEFAARVCAGAAAAPPSRYPGIDENRARVDEAAAVAGVCLSAESSPLRAVLLDAILEGRTSVDFAVLEACLAPLRDRGPPAFAPFVFLGCEGAYLGHQPDGGSCALPTECVSGHCRVGGGSCGGVCAARVALGATCGPEDECVAGSYCSGSRCIVEPPSTIRGRGESCTGDYQCDGDEFLVCRGATGARICTDPPPAGDPCHDSSLLPCTLGAYCDGATCRARIALGSTCTDAASCVSGARCGGSPMRCLAVATPDAACGPDQVCVQGTSCVAGTCQQLPDVGEACDGTCLRGVCMAGTCRSQPIGTTCPAGFRLFDLFDPCGDGGTCTDRSGSFTCVATAASGASCATSGVLCNEPADFCSDRDICEPICSID